MDNKILFTSREEFRTWLMENCLAVQSVWLVFDKSNNQTSIRADEALEEALCFGWIDGQIKSIDEQTYLKYFSIRRKNSKWSNKNKQLVSELEKKGIMTDFGRAKIQEAKENGEWDKDHTLQLTEQDLEDFIEKLKEIEPAYTHFIAMSMSVKKTYLKAYHSTKTPEGKAKRWLWIINRLNQNLKPM